MSRFDNTPTFTVDPYDQAQRDFEGCIYCPYCVEYIPEEDWENHNCTEEE